MITSPGLTKLTKKRGAQNKESALFSYAYIAYSVRATVPVTYVFAHLHLAPSLRMSGAIPLRPYIPSWAENGNFSFLSLKQGNVLLMLTAERKYSSLTQDKLLFPITAVCVPMWGKPS
jgi:hypothetical protein